MNLTPPTVTVSRSIGESGPLESKEWIQPALSDERLREHGVYVLRRLMTPAAAASLAEDLTARRELAQLTPDPSIPGAWSAYAEPIFQVLLLRTKAVVEALARASVDPTYSYARIYVAGNDLPPHVDREACEVSVSIALGAAGGFVWPFSVSYDGKTFQVALHPGDGVLYLGHECEHWREALPVAWSAHVFLHYVFSDGQYAGYRFDERPTPA